MWLNCYSLMRKVNEELLLNHEQRRWLLEMDSVHSGDAVNIVEIIAKDLEYYINWLLIKAGQSVLCVCVLCVSAHVCEFYCNKGDVREKVHKKKCTTMVILVVFRPSNCRTHFSCICMFENFPFRIRKSKCDVNFKIKMYPEGFVLQQAGDSANTKPMSLLVECPLNRHKG